MNPVLFFSALLNGTVNGMIYAMLGLGISIIVGLLYVPNFAHGALFALGGYTLVSSISTPLGFWGGVVLAGIVVTAVGSVIEMTGIRRLYYVERYYKLLFTFGLALVLREVIILIWGPVGKTVQPPEFLRGVVDLGILPYPKYRLVIMILTSVLVFAAYWFIEKTKYGAIIRAGIEDQDMVSALGINIRRVFNIAFAAGAGLAGVGGALIAPVRGLLPDLGILILPYAFVVVIVGGLGSLPGAIVGGLLVGLVQAFVTMIWAPGADAAVFAIASLVLLVRPQGLMGKS